MNNNYPELRYRYILNNENEFFSLLNEIDSNTIPFDELMKDGNFEAERKITLIKRLPAENISREMAIVIRNTVLEISKPYVLAAWELLELKEKYQLLLNHLEVFDNSELPGLFNELEYMYKDLSHRTRHKVSLYCNDYNEALLKKLKEKGYVSSIGYEDREKTIFNPLPHKEIEKYVYAWVRAV